ncbi:MAG: hypothetical protein CMQ38_02140 [Gammaproteobacteria bacterium]|nr:hypothetical protein [Gammaproteobacteria bacterium]|tara:strand:+ start:982 stop:1638 length:657 start_codon:yes stop_codon:yes gene_type:complete
MQKTHSRNRILAYCLAAATPLLLMALIFNFSLLFNGQYIFWTSLDSLGYIIQAEFLALASGVLIILPLIIQNSSLLIRLLRFLLFAILAVVFSWVAYDIDGMAGMLFYALLIFITFGGGTLFVFDLFSTQSRAYLTMLRWSLGLFLYVSLQLSFDLDSNIANWKDTPQVVPFGAAYFYLLFLFELILYPPLLYYLERKHSEDSFISDKIARINQRQTA